MSCVHGACFLAWFGSSSSSSAGRAQALKDFEMQHMAAQLQLGLGCYSFEGGEPEEVLSLTTSTLQVQFRVPRSLASAALAGWP